MPMLSNNQLKQFAALKVKKFRQKYSQFVVEGKKSIKELRYSNFSIDTVLFREKIDNDIFRLFPNAKLIENCGEQLGKISSFETPGDILAVFNIKENPLLFEDTKQSASLFLDEIQDPGNLGTIIRIASWFGFNQLVLSKGCADIYNPKTIQASMGGIGKIKFCYTDKNEWFSQVKETKLPVLGAFLNGENIHHYTFPKACVIVIGNEGNGISPEVEKFITQKITIPGSGQMESLNAAMATAIVLDNVFRGLQ